MKIVHLCLNKYSIVIAEQRILHDLNTTHWSFSGQHLNAAFFPHDMNAAW